MGIGDEIMVTGEVKRRRTATVRRFAIRNPRHFDKVRWDVIWEGNPYIAKPGEPYDAVLDNAGGCRPYILAKSDRAWGWKLYVPTPGEIFLTDIERAVGRHTAGWVIVSPTLKPSASPNKRWPYWQQLIDANRDVPWLQIGAPSDARLAGVPFLPTLTFRDAVGALAGARAAVLHEGGLHHAAAAVGLRAVVIFGGYISPRVTGYELHRNLFVESRAALLGCGLRFPCTHCLKAMQAITVSAIRAELEVILSTTKEEVHGG